VAAPICPISPDRAKTAFHLPNISSHSLVYYEARASPALSPLTTSNQ
jgi:hypothetical protein